MIKIPNFTVKEVIGQGGMALVYLATQDMLSREVALKVLMPDMMKDDSLRKSFLNEGKIVASLKHPNIVSIFDIGIEGDSLFYMAMEYISGGTLKEKLSKEAFSYDAAVTALGEISDGLSYAHEQGYIHRDIKPGNILFRENGAAVLTDFGIAKLQDSSGDLTRLGLTIGTAQYMSPEQAKSAKLDSRSDIYSLGLVFFEMLTGKKAFKFESNYQAIQHHTTAPPPKLPEQYAFLQLVINKVLAKKPKDRYQTAPEFVQAIKNAGRPSRAAASVTKATIHTDTTIVHTIKEPAVWGLKSKPYLWFSASLFVLVGVLAIVFFSDVGNKLIQKYSTILGVDTASIDAVAKPDKPLVINPREQGVSTQKPTELGSQEGESDIECNDASNNGVVYGGNVFINGVRVGSGHRTRKGMNTICENRISQKSTRKKAHNLQPSKVKPFKKGCDDLASLVKDSLSRISNDNIFGMSAYQSGEGFLCAQRDLLNQLDIFKKAIQKENYEVLEAYIYPPTVEGKSMQNIGDVLVLPYLPGDKVSTHTQMIELPFRKYSKGIFVNIISNIVMTMDMGSELMPAELQDVITSGGLKEAQKSSEKALKDEYGAFNISFKRNTLEATFYKRKQSFAIYELNRGWSIMYYDYKTLNNIKDALPKEVTELLTNSLARSFISRRN